MTIYFITPNSMTIKGSRIFWIREEHFGTERTFIGYQVLLSKIIVKKGLKISTHKTEPKSIKMAAMMEFRGHIGVLRRHV